MVPRRRGSIANNDQGSRDEIPVVDAAASKNPSTEGSTTEGSTTARAAQNPGAPQRSPSTMRHRIRAIERRQAELHAQSDSLNGELSQAGADHQRMIEIGELLNSSMLELESLDEEWMGIAAEAEERGLTL